MFNPHNILTRGFGESHGWYSWRFFFISEVQMKGLGSLVYLSPQYMPFQWQCPRVVEIILLLGG